jgi:hypothetical protein
MGCSFKRARAEVRHLTTRCLPMPQAREADPAGWAIGWGAWPAGMREDECGAACFRRAAWLEAVRRRPERSIRLKRREQRGMKLTIRPLTADLWPALEDLFGKSGASNGCWCMHWRIDSAHHKRPRAKNKAAFRSIVRRGPPPGLRDIEGDLAVGWCQLTP